MNEGPRCEIYYPNGTIKVVNQQEFDEWWGGHDITKKTGKEIEDKEMIRRQEVLMGRFQRENRFLKRALLVVGTITLINLSLVLSGCAPTVKSGVATVNRGLVQIDQALDRHNRDVIKSLDTAIERCKKLNLKTPEEREECLGDAGEPIDMEQMQKTRNAYNRIVESLRAIKDGNGD